MKASTLQRNLFVSCCLSIAVLGWLVLRRGGDDPRQAQAWPSHSPLVSIEHVDVAPAELALPGADSADEQGVRVARTRLDEPQRLSAAGTLTGLVIDSASGLPVPAATVQVLMAPAQSRSSTPVTIERATTDPAGAFRFEGLRPSPYHLSASAPEWTPTFVDEVVVSAGREARVEIRMSRGAALEVKVVADEDGLGLPIEGARVEFLVAAEENVVWLRAQEREARTLATTTDAAGKGRLQVPVGRFPMYVSARGFARARQIVEVGARGAETVAVLSRGKGLHGTVSLADGTRIGGAWVFISLPMSLSFKGDRSALYHEEFVRTNDQGEFAFTGLPAGRHCLTAVDEHGVAGYGPPEGFLGAEAGSAAIALVISAVADIRGIVLDESRTAIGGASLTLHQSALFAMGKSGKGIAIDRVPELMAKRQRVAQSDDRGAFTFERVGLEEPAVTLVFSAPGCVEQKRKVEIAELLAASPFEWIVKGLGEPIGGRIIDKRGDPVAGFPVGISSAIASEATEWSLAALTDESGAFTAIPPSGVPALTVRPHWESPLARFHRGEPSVATDVAPGTQDLTFVCTDDSLLVGAVVDGDTGEPLRSFELFLFSDVKGGFWPGKEFHDDQGRFEVSFNRDSDLFLRVSALGYEPRDVRGLELRGDKPLVVELRKGATLAGRIRAHDGEPVVGALVGISTYAADSTFPPASRYAPAAITDSVGRFELAGAPDLQRGVLVVCPNRGDASPLVYVDWAIDDGSQELEIRLPPAHPVRLTMKSLGSGSPRGTAFLVDAKVRNLNPALEYSLDRVAPGRLEGYLRFSKGVLSTQLSEGSYTLHYAPPSNPSRLESFDFMVTGQGPNEHEFLVLE